MYLLRWDSRLVVSDIDGTITRSDLLGHVLPAIGVDWSHAGISQLFTNIESNGYQVRGRRRRAWWPCWTATATTGGEACVVTWQLCAPYHAATVASYMCAFLMQSSGAHAPVTPPSAADVPEQPQHRSGQHHARVPAPPGAAGRPPHALRTRHHLAARAAAQPVPRDDPAQAARVQDCLPAGKTRPPTFAGVHQPALSFQLRIQFDASVVQATVLAVTPSGTLFCIEARLKFAVAVRRTFVRCSRPTATPSTRVWATGTRT